jgi:hypothetical protein
MTYFQAFLLFCLLFVAFHAKTQTNIPPCRAMNNAFVEWRGVTGHYSVNYERLLLRTWKNRVLLGAGTGFSSFTYGVSKWNSFLFRANLALGYRQVYGEIGVDFLSVHENYKSWRLGSVWDKYRFVRYGLRYQALKKGLFIRTYVFPIHVDLYRDKYLYHIGYDYDDLKKTKKRFWWGGVEVGYSF